VSLADGCALPNGINGGASSVVVNGNVASSPAAGTHSSGLLIVDARSYAAAVANRAKGGGCECQGNSSYTFSANLILDFHFIWRF